MRPRDVNTETAQFAPGPHEVPSDAAPVGPRWGLTARPPLESDRRLVLTTPLEDVIAILDCPAALAAWFSVARRQADRTGSVVVELPYTATVLYGRETWMDDQHSLIFDSERPVARGYVSLRTVILPTGGFGTEIWTHVEMPRGRPGHQHFAALERVVGRGLGRMRAELDRSSR